MKLSRFALPFTLIPATAFADVTPQDVWDNMSAAYAAGGMTLEGTPTADGNALSITDAVLRVTYPVVGGSATLTMPAFTLTAQGDGTVAITTPATYVMELAADIPGEDGLISADITLAQTGASSVASGDPGDVTYTSSADTLDMLVNDLQVPGEEVTFDLELTSAGYSGTTRITEGENVTIVTDMLNGAADTKFVVEAGPIRQESTNSGAELTTKATIVLPPDMNILDLTPALLAGLSVTASSVAGPSSGTSLSYMDGELTTEQVQSAGNVTSTFSMDASGLRAEAAADGFDFTMTDQNVMPFPISASGNALTADFAIPLVAQDTAQDFKYAFSLEGITIDEQLWSIFDAGNALDHSPIDLTIDLSGSLLWGLNLLNFEELAALEDAPLPPIMPESVSINTIAVSAFGATANAIGAFTFDATDFQTIPGMPRPEGTATVTATGVNAVIDQLIAAGFVAEEDAMMPRMMMGMFARTVGEDQLETVVEVNAEGHVIVNGQRMR